MSRAFPTVRDVEEESSEHSCTDVTHKRVQSSVKDAYWDFYTFLLVFIYKITYLQNA